MRLDELREVLYVGLADERDRVRKQRADRTRKMGNVEDEIGQIEVKLENLQETSSIRPPGRSLRPVGPNRKLIVALTIVVGLLAGVVVAFFAEFLQKAKAARTHGN